MNNAQLVTAATRTRKIVNTKPVVDVQKTLESKLNQLALHAEAIKKNKLAAEQIEQELFDMMQQAKVRDVNTAFAYAEITRPMGKAKNEVDPVKLHEITGTEFYSLISVLITKVRDSKLLTERELTNITTHTPGELGDPKLVIKYK
jgi:hypothetical protein